MFVIEATCHNYQRFDLREQKEVKANLYLFDPEKGPVMSNDVIWLQSITRADSGTWFTTSEDKALQYTKEAEADDMLSKLVMEFGYLPGDLTITKLVEKAK